MRAYVCACVFARARVSVYVYACVYNLIKSKKKYSGYSLIYFVVNTGSSRVRKSRHISPRATKKRWCQGTRIVLRTAMHRHLQKSGLEDRFFRRSTARSKLLGLLCNLFNP